jgi:predicted AlkP superfamily phosphohydrolase/phosphomutase
MSAHERVVVIGLDAMDPGIARRLAREGRLPTIASLFEQAAWVPTLNPYGLVVGGVWPSFATACWPSRHGFFSHLKLVPGTYEMRATSPYDVAGEPLWTTLSRHGKRCAVVDVPLSPPVELDGLQVVDWGTHDRMLSPRTVPTELLTDIHERFGTHTITGRCDHYTGADAHERLRDDLLAGVERKLALSRWLLDREEWDLFVTVFSESHCADHHFWQHQDPGYPGHDPARQAALGRPLELVYERLDGALATLLDQAGDACVYVLLSHGVGPHYDADHLLVAILQRLQDAHRPPRRAVRYREAGLRRLRYARRTLTRADDRYPHDWGAYVDSSRDCFKVPNNELYGGIRFNLAGREPRGRLRRGAELDAWFERLRAGLLELENVETGGPVVRDVIRTDDVYERREPDNLPDALVDWHRSDPIRGVRSPRIGTITGEYRGLRTGDHRPTGLLFVRAADIQPGPRDEAVAIVDVAPTIAARLGVELHDVDGRPDPRLGRRTDTSVSR